MIPIYSLADQRSRIYIIYIITAMFDEAREQQLQQMIANKATMGERSPRISEAILERTCPFLLGQQLSR